MRFYSKISRLYMHQVAKPTKRVRIEEEMNSSVSLRELNHSLEVLASSAVPSMSAQTEMSNGCGIVLWELAGASEKIEHLLPSCWPTKCTLMKC